MTFHSSCPILIVYIFILIWGEVMEDILQKLIELEQRAQSILKPAESELANIDSIIKIKVSEILDEVDKNLSIKITQIRALSKEQTTAQKVEIDNKVSIQLAKLEEEWDKNAHIWCEEMFGKIIKLKDA